MKGEYRHLFGPVRSRRLGRSLGIDLVPFKVCTFDCPYCQVGATTSKTVDRREYAPVDEVLNEFDRWMVTDGQADHITLAGAGEPTLHSRFGEVIEEVGRRVRIRRVLLSNGSLFHLPDVRAAAARADVVKGTLGAWDQASFEAVHRPHASLAFATFFDGLKAMRAGFEGEFWLEVFVVPGINDAPVQMDRLADLAREVHPDRIHLNTAVRPPQDGSLKAVAPERLAELAVRFEPVAEVTASTGAAPANGAQGVRQDSAALDHRVLALVRRHPCTVDDLAVALSCGVPEAAQAVKRLTVERLLREDRRAGTRFYVAV